ncbi:PepSY domain-containing protein [Mammaliicoccus sciuri]|uniref:PepSY domain-containing protein n=1 Tax=Mammaliicoccus sciuri TaxID=1296 RepID=A0AB37HT63_MAMSC|nr:PepSY domain-containing protein [Mammaliicoccus sciuri]MCD8800122.1 PepSY domain-containing protein [Mammaliicoccus sciuri]MCJ0967328.1 PepSY domain-containing protein [Mammaliicoccus sciuri]MEB5650828.1 PepSY domain-containing protein [Mammaliicoccus sciuri]MEB6338802.1 PepSY domain-containing protein [Mammaliicoccus sciuri]MEB6343467.1 PepSY domain-containing protein [Mammaliicoccus sciuri]
MKYKMLSLLLSAGIVLAACGNSDDDNNDKKDNQNDEKTEQTTKENSNDDQNTDDNQSSDKTTENTVKWDDVKVSPEDAVKAAQKESEGELKDLSFEKETGDWSYKVELVDGTNENKVLINADDKSVTNVEKEQEDSDDNDQTFKLSDVAKFEDALKVAQDKAKGDIKEWSLSEDNGKLVYSIELKEGNKESTEFTIDAKSKEILEQETD